MLLPCPGFTNVLKILTRESSRDELLSFIQHYGSHYVAEALYGSELTCLIHFPSKKVQQQLWLQYQKGKRGLGGAAGGLRRWGFSALTPGSGACQRRGLQRPCPSPASVSRDRGRQLRPFPCGRFLSPKLAAGRRGPCPITAGPALPPVSPEALEELRTGVVSPDASSFPGVSEDPDPCVCSPCV